MKAIGTILLFAAFAYASDSRDGDVIKAAETFQKCWDTKDTVCMDKVLTDDYLMAPRLPPLLDKTAFYSLLKAGRFSTGPAKKVTEPPNFRFRYYGSVAIMTFSNSAICCTETAQTAVMHYFTTVWTNGDRKGWRLASYHASVPPLQTQSR